MQRSNRYGGQRHPISVFIRCLAFNANVKSQKKVWGGLESHVRAGCVDDTMLVVGGVMDASIEIDCRIGCRRWYRPS